MAVVVAHQAVINARRLAIVAVAVLVMASAAAANQFDGQPVVGVTVTGLRHIREEFVTAQMQTRVGRLFDQSTADRDVVRLEQLRVFSAIAINPVMASDGLHVEVVVAEIPRLIPAVSVSVTDESGVSIGPAVKLVSVSGRPVNITVATQFGGESLLKLSEVSPLFTSRRLWQSADVSLRDRTNRLGDFKERSVDLDARVGVRGSERLKAGAIVQVYGVRSDKSEAMLSGGSRDTFAGFGGIVEYDSRDSLTTATRGWWNSVDAIWHGGSGEYTTFNVDIRRYQPVTSRQMLLVTTLVTLQSGEPGVDVPTYTDYAIGGENTVRGWDFASRRGKNQAVASLEYRHMTIPTRAYRVGSLNVYAGLALAVFGDVGSAWSAPSDFTRHTISGGGVGLRLFVPYIDLIRLDFSFGESWQMAVGINEKAVAQRGRVR